MQSYKKIKTAVSSWPVSWQLIAHKPKAFNQAQTRADTDLREAVEKLSQVRQQIEMEKMPLSTKIATLEAEVIEARKNEIVY